MYVQGVSTRKAKGDHRERCGHAFSGSSVSAINKRLDESLEAFAKRPFGEPLPYLVFDRAMKTGYFPVPPRARGGVVATKAVLIAVGVDWDGRCHFVVDLANRENRPSWRDFLLALK